MLVSGKSIRNISDESLFQLMENPGEYSPSLLGFEYIRRNSKDNKKIRIGFPADILTLVKGYINRKQEHFFIFTLDGANQLIKRNLITVGVLNRTIIHPREVYAKAIQQKASAVIAAHNHPSGNVKPSREDELITDRLRESGEVIGIHLLDHIIFCRDDYYSFLEKGKVIR